MKLSFDFEGNKVSYNLTYKKRPNISINVEENGQVSVIAPPGTPALTVIDKVKGHASWIVSEIARLKQTKENANQYMYLGKTYGIDIIENAEQEKTTVKLVRGKFVIEGKYVDQQRATEALLKWYLTKTTSKIKERAKLFAEHFEKMPKKFDTKIIKNKLWHVEEDLITFDVNCGIGPTYILDCVLLEALCVFNDIEDSEAVLKKFIPEAELAQTWVKENSARFIFR